MFLISWKCTLWKTWDYNPLLYYVLILYLITRIAEMLYLRIHVLCYATWNELLLLCLFLCKSISCYNALFILTPCTLKMMPPHSRVVRWKKWLQNAHAISSVNCYCYFPHIKQNVFCINCCLSSLYFHCTVTNLSWYGCSLQAAASVRMVHILSDN